MKKDVDLMTREVTEGFQASPKYVLSKYFYDEKGSELFTRIMHMREYYLTDSELEIFRNSSHQIVNSIFSDSRPVNLVELGAGDGFKTRLLVDAIMKRSAAFSYVPIDISAEAIQQLQDKFDKQYPNLHIRGKVKDYETGLGELKDDPTAQNVVLFLGSTIGNFEHSDAVDFLKMIHHNMRADDVLLIGFDLVKDPDIIIKAYNDPQGITREFNLNLLDRFNRELGADFDRSGFRHYPVYDPYAKAARSYLLSTRDQDVHFAATGQTIRFNRWEFIFTEISRKFDHDLIKHLADEAGFRVEKNFVDGKNYFLDSLWKKKS